jgi:hypothetical protein
MGKIRLSFSRLGGREELLGIGRLQRYPGLPNPTIVRVDTP